ncbi:RNA-directed DNA polymerase [Pectobacterium brasiliense]|uniref:retron St85 family RNA-directed DNA polymerase n=1 Tax=Pectobacterium brasiliense TaxID=180957 RepID=UPI001969252F|nr:retron St85 family RNA-directed DNA polymerase [Pectobacterium brasiliense]MBN3069911.1 RNA-directed DNA polymerase [Pectobacterium brasiliense]MBN3246959.1 RNA-directed DNA polymerase [Pectobacterium brasiliense]
MPNQYQGLYTQRLLSLPILQTLDDLATKTRLPKTLLVKYIHDNERYYNSSYIKKKSKDLRTISNPNRELKAIQRWILRNVLSSLSPSPYANGFIPKKSIIDNARPHRGNQYILSIDLKNFFTTVKASYVFTVFKSVGYASKMAYYLTSICTLNGVLPQGAPTSPMLSNLVCLRMDERIGKYCENKALTYSRYADDITISGNKLAVIKKAWIIIRKIISEENFTVNKKKEMLSGPQSQRKVTGVIVTPEIGIGREKYNYFRKRIFILVKKNGDNMSNVVNGILAHVKSIDLGKYKKLNDYYEQLINKTI